MRKILLLLTFFVLHAAHALTADEAKAIALGETDARIAALGQAVPHADDKTAAFLQALADDAVKSAGDRVFIVRDEQVTDPVTGAAVSLPADAEDVVSNNRMRGELDSALAALRLFSKDDKVRAAAVADLQKDPDESRLPLIAKAYAAEHVPAIKEQLALVRAAALLTSSDRMRRLEAAELLAASRSPATRSLLLERLRREADPQVKAALQASAQRIEASLVWGERAAADDFATQRTSWPNAAKRRRSSTNSAVAGTMPSTVITKKLP